MNTENSFIPGQRWISDAESELGLGTVLVNNGRQVTLVFMFSGETRIYAGETAPLTRVRFSRGDRIESHEGWHLTVRDVEESEGLLIYLGTRDNGENEILPETSLSNFIRLNKPQERLLTGQLDDNKWFELRAETYSHLQKLSHSPTHGLRGARIDLIPHQIYIAQEVGGRLAPRVLLADEVGLGKTIEAGLILHYRLLREEISRVLVVVPDPLIHQWLVEMLRRFNLQFQIMDDEKFRAIKEEDESINPFSSAQLVLCSLPFLVSSPDIEQDALDAGWDTLVVDEAHHLGWNEDQASEEYNIVENLACISPSVLLLTATPEQLGQTGHFARLRLLDSDRFSDLATFIEETSHYREIAQLANLLQEDQPLNDSAIDSLTALLGEDFLALEQWQNLRDCDAEQAKTVRQDLLDRMIDQHGTGRLLFRNTRSAIQGFPQRHLNYHELPKDVSETDALCNWLNGFLREQYPDKSLFICSSPDTVLEIAEQLRVRFGIHAAVFHEQMSIVARDRAAAWFSNPEDDCLLMISSEIGSEGRNFQFLHNLILHEIPANPDLLEQRIGRLDRIGQRSDIQIHVPCQNHSVDLRLTRWYHEGLNAFEKTSAMGTAIANDLALDLEAILAGSDSLESDRLTNLIDKSQKLAVERSAQLEQGRDKLLEFNSNRPEKIADLLESLQLADKDRSLPRYMMSVFDCFGVDFEEQSDRSWIVRPGRHMSVSGFPGIPDEGITLTFDRKMALAREDVSFLTWDHPIVSGAMDLVVSGTNGQACISIIEWPELPHAALFMEALYRVECTVSQDATLHRYLPPETLRFVVNESGQDLSDTLTESALSLHLQAADRKQTRTFIKSKSDDIKPLIETATSMAMNHLPDARAESRTLIESEYNQEIARLKHLQSINSMIRDEEIHLLEDRRDILLKALDGVAVSLVGLRVLVNIH